jgi:hypothetical protein
MINSHFEAKITSVEVQDTIRCNRCGRCVSMKVYSDERNNYHTFKAGGGFASTYPEDLDQIEFHLCSECLKAFVDTFVIPVRPVSCIAPAVHWAIHSETMDVMVTRGGWAFKVPDFSRLQPNESLEQFIMRLPRDLDVYQFCPKEDVDEAMDSRFPDYWRNCYPAAGIYFHHKGNLYEVLEGAVDAVTFEPLVLYRPLYENEIGGLWLRPARMWGEMVEGSRRFELVKP